MRISSALFILAALAAAPSPAAGLPSDPRAPRPYAVDHTSLTIGVRLASRGFISAPAQHFAVLARNTNPSERLYHTRDHLLRRIRFPNRSSSLRVRRFRSGTWSA